MFRKNLHLCFSRIHCLPTSHPLTLEDKDEQQHHEFIKCFNSLYDLPAAAADEYSSEPDFSSVVSSHRRFFVSTPGTSNSILDSAAVKKPPSTVLEGGVPVRKYSPDPYVDFRESMEEMVRARREIRDPTAEINGLPMSLSDEWEYLHQLLMCYLSLNPKRAHKFIIGAFTDLVLSSS